MHVAMTIRMTCATLGGADHREPFLTHDQVVAGGVLRLEVEE